MWKSGSLWHSYVDFNTELLCTTTDSRWCFYVSGSDTRSISQGSQKKLQLYWNTMYHRASVGWCTQLILKRNKCRKQSTNSIYHIWTSSCTASHSGRKGIFAKGSGRWSEQKEKMDEDMHYWTKAYRFLLIKVLNIVTE